MPKSVNLLKAFWVENKQGVVFLSRNWNQRSLPKLSCLETNAPLQPLRPLPPQYTGYWSGYFIEDGKIHFLLHQSDFPDIQPGSKIYVTGSFNGWKDVVDNEEWRLQQKGDRSEFWTVSFPLAYFDTKTTHYFRFFLKPEQWLPVPTRIINRTPDGFGGFNYELNWNRGTNYAFTFGPPTEDFIKRKTTIVFEYDTLREEMPVSSAEILGIWNYQDRLGVIIENDCTSFHIFAPRASSVTLHTYRNLDESDKKVLPLKADDSGVWSLFLTDNLEGFYYYYTIDGIFDPTTAFDPNVRILDPYAKAAVGPKGPGIITNRYLNLGTPAPFKVPYWQDLIIAECHVRDLIQHAPTDIPSDERKGFAGLTRFIKDKGNYLRSLGINAIELQPIQEYEYDSPQEYQWGYMPTNYFSPASGYATAPEKASQIEEFRAVVDACHDAGLAVILDVVYNHVGNPNHLMRLDKETFFHLAPDDSFMNWSGCGNDLRCESPVTKRLIIESLTHLVRYYDVDGFRFDLADLIGKSVLVEIELALKLEKPSVILIAEPWSFHGHIGPALRDTGWSSWNDGFRNFVADYVRAHGNQEGIAYFLKGSPHGYARFPSQTVNYTESHDDRCWLDIITESPNNDGSMPTTRDIRRTHMMFAILLTAIGIPMIAAGQDFLRSKHGKNNTYLDGEENALNYMRMIQFAGTHAYVRNWIKFRKSDWGNLLRLQSRQSESYVRCIYVNGFSSVLAVFNADGSMGASRIAVAFNPHESSVHFGNGNEINWQNMRQIADTERFNIDGLESGKIPIIDNAPMLPPLSCAAWIME